MSLTAFLGKRSDHFLFIFNLLLILMIGYLDYETGFETGLYVFYFLPIIAVAWYMKTPFAILFSAISAGVWFLVDVLSQKVYSNAFVPYWNLGVRFTAFSSVVVFLSKIKSSFEVQKLLSQTDPLTGATNRRTFFHFSNVEIDRLRRYKRVFTAVYIDVDNFKLINDKFGHRAGDMLLKSVVKTIRETLRRIDVVARVGGDEFAILLPETGAVHARIVIDRLLSKLLHSMEMNEWPVTFSIGIVTFNKPPLSAEDMLRKADELMYTAKNSGKNSTRQEVFDEPSLSESE